VNTQKKITLVKSLIAVKPKHKLTAKSLGLKKIGDNTVQNDDAVLAGKIKAISYLIQVESL
jgi:large subunit ribosomal protein L30